jgi:hypothetical protein
MRNQKAAGQGYMLKQKRVNVNLASIIKRNIGGKADKDEQK